MEFCYIISAINEYGEEICRTETDSQKKAIEKWFLYGKNSPTMVSIQAKNNECARNLLQWVDRHQKDVRKLRDILSPLKQIMF